MKKVISLILSLTMLLSITAGLDLTVYASNYTGTCGNNVSWLLNTSTGELTISGKGTMNDYDSYAYVPWYKYSSDIKTATILSGVTSIGKNVFTDCINLNSVSISDSVVKIDKEALGYCPALTSVTVSSDNNTFSSSNGVLFNYDKTKLIYYPIGKANKSYSIPSSVSTIGYKAFYSSKLTGVTIPDSVTSIKSWAFACCESLTDLTIPDSVTSIGNDSFYCCRRLKKVKISNNIKKISDGAFDNCDNLTNLEIPDSVTNIGNFAFYYCLKLESVTIGSSVTKIGKYAFGDCESLKNIKLPKSVTSIGQYAFRNCTNLKDVYYGSSKKNWKKISIKSENSYLTSATIHYNSYPNSTSVKKLTKKSKAFKVTWTKKSNITGYQVQYATNQSFTKNKKTVTVKKASTTSKIVKGLKSKKTYYVRVRTYKTVSGKKVYSNWSTVKKVKTK